MTTYLATALAVDLNGETEEITLPFCSPGHRDQASDVHGWGYQPLLDTHYEFDDLCFWCRELIPASADRLLRLSLMETESGRRKLAAALNGTLTGLHLISAFDSDVFGDVDPEFDGSLAEIAVLELSVRHGAIDIEEELDRRGPASFSPERRVATDDTKAQLARRLMDRYAPGVKEEVILN